MDIKQSVQLNDEKPAVVQVRNTEKSQVLAVGLKKGQVLKKHVTSWPAVLVLLQGQVSFEMEGAVTEISVMNTFDIPENVPHEVTANEESIFLVIKEK